jgi:hypothetical protein
LLCWLTLTRLAQSRMALARGVVVLNKLGLVSIWYSAEREAVLLTLPWWKPQRGQSLSEYALLLGITGGLAWALLSMSGQTLTELVALVVHILFSGWADWILIS